MDPMKIMLWAKVKGELFELQNSLQVIDKYLKDTDVEGLDTDYLKRLEREVSNAISTFADL